MLQLQPYLEQWADQGFRVFFVTMVGAEFMRDFIGDQDLIMDVLIDRERTFFRHYGVTAVPHSLIIDKKGIIQDTKLGWGSDGVAWLQGWVEKLTK